MPEWLGFILFLYAATVLILSLTEIELWGKNDEHYASLTPVHLHHYTKMNWFGCYATWLLLGIISPLVFLIKLGWFIFHIGKFKEIL
jgi:hypothetical protein